MNIKSLFIIPFFVPLSGCFLAQLDTGVHTGGDRTIRIHDYERAYDEEHPEEAHIEGAFGQHSYEFIN